MLKPSGSIWLNLGDSYSRGATSKIIPAKSLVLAPERLLIALSEQGWIVRNKVIWAKTNPMPASVKDRLSTTHEYVYFLTRSHRYFFDLDRIRIPPVSTTSTETSEGNSGEAVSAVPPTWAGPLSGTNSGLRGKRRSGSVGHPLGKNPGDVWRLATSNFRGAHFATFPTSLVDTPLLATCPERICATCGRPWQRQTTKSLGRLAVLGELQPICRCTDQHWRPGLVLDPFFGSGTVGVAAEAHGRQWLGIEVNPEFITLAERRLKRERRSRTPPAEPEAA